MSKDSGNRKRWAPVGDRAGVEVEGAQVSQRGPRCKGVVSCCGVRHVEAPQLGQRAEVAQACTA